MRFTKFLSAVLIGLSVFTIFELSAPEANAVNACNQVDAYDENYCKFLASDAAGNQSLLSSCKDRWGYGGKDYLWYVSFGVSGNGKITLGQDLPFNLELVQECNAIQGSYKVSVSLLDKDGRAYSSENQTSTFRYRNKTSEPTLSYCSTSTCGGETISGVIKLPSTAPEGTYRVRVRVTPYGAASASDAKTTTMSRFLSTTAQLPQIPVVEKLEWVESNDGMLSCYLTDIVDSVKNDYEISGTDWQILEDGSLIDSHSNFPIAATDNTKVTPLARGFLMSMFTEATGTRIYAYAIKDQKRGSKYECKIALNTKFGIGTFAATSKIAKVSTNGLNAIPNEPVVTQPKATTIYCKKGKLVRSIKAIKPNCPKGYVKVKTAKG